MKHTVQTPNLGVSEKTPNLGVSENTPNLGVSTDSIRMLHDELNVSRARKVLAELKRARAKHTYKLVQVDSRTWKEVRV
jgi:hypothetical protein